jgi:hypothetical protein
LQTEEQAMSDRTHYDDCWRDHPQCVLPKIERLEHALKMQRGHTERADEDNQRLRDENAALREAAGKVTCRRCNSTGEVPCTNGPVYWDEPCPDCAALRALLEKP